MKFKKSLDPSNFNLLGFKMNLKYPLQFVLFFSIVLFSFLKEAVSARPYDFFNNLRFINLSKVIQLLLHLLIMVIHILLHLIFINIAQNYSHSFDTFLTKN